MGSADERSAAAQLLRERAARCDVGRFTRAMRRLLRNDRRTGLCISRCRRQLEAHRARSACGAVRGSANSKMKFQIPSSKSQTNLKSQVPKGLYRAVFLVPEHWNLKFSWSLDVGTWDLSLCRFASFSRLTCARWPGLMA